MTTPAVVQHTYASNGGGGNIGITFGSTPTVGNLVVAAIIAAENNFTRPAVAANGWTSAVINDGKASNCSVQIFYRYVVAGDTATYGALSSSSNSFSTSTWAFELSGVPATWAAAIQASEADANTMAAGGGTTGSETTTSIDTLALVFAGTFFDSGGVAISGTGWTVLSNGTSPHSAAGSQVYSTLGSTVQATVTITGPNGGVTPVYAQLLFNPGGSTPPPTSNPQTYAAILG